MLDFNKTILSEKVLLRPMIIEDFEGMKQLTKDREMWYFFTADLSDEAVLKKWITTALSDHKSQKALPFTILDPSSQKIIGTTRIGSISHEHSRLEIGWTWISKDYQGTGINGLVKQLLFEYIFTQTEILRIEFKTDILNTPAQRGLEKAGLTKEGILRSHTLMTNNRRRDTVYYSMLKEEWKKLR